jgi:hypothetical protein
MVRLTLDEGETIHVALTNEGGYGLTISHTKGEFKVVADMRDNRAKRAGPKDVVIYHETWEEDWGPWWCDDIPDLDEEGFDDEPGAEDVE